MIVLLLAGCLGCGGPGGSEDADRDVPFVERCNGFDDDQDGLVDEYATDAIHGWQDDDGDGYGSLSVSGCLEEGEYATVSGDCDDGSTFTHPGATERCLDAVDDDCDGLRYDAPDGEAKWYPDLDLDGLGDVTGATSDRCDPGPGWSAIAGDCDDDDREVQRPEVTYADEDGDGWGNPDHGWHVCEGASSGGVAQGGDCRDANPDVSPGVSERCGNLVDDDCDGLVDEGLWWPDADGDGWGDALATPASRCEPLGDEAARGGDCDDADPDVSPDAEDLPGEDLDRDCDGVIAPPMPLLGRYAPEPNLPEVVALGDVDQDGLTDIALSTYTGAALVLGGDPERYPWEADLLVVDGPADGLWPRIALASEDLVGGPTPDLVVRDWLPDRSGRVYVVDGDRRGVVESDQADAFLLGWANRNDLGEHLAGMGPEEEGGPNLLALTFDSDVHLVEGPFETVELLADERARLRTDAYAFVPSSLDAPADLDGDGWRDLVVSAYADGPVLDVVTERPTGTVDLEGTRIDLTSGECVVGSPGDFDGDGLADLSTVTTGDRRARLWSFASASRPVEGAAIDGVSALAPAGDLDGDGADDVLVVGTDGLVHLLALPSSGVWDLGASASAWRLPSPPPYGWPLRAVGDTSGDGAVDFVLAMPDGALLLSP